MIRDKCMYDERSSDNKPAGTGNAYLSGPVEAT